MITKKFKLIDNNYCELKYFNKVISILSEYLDDTYNLIFTNMYDTNLEDYNPKKKNIVIFVSDEFNTTPKWKDKVDFIFRTYGNNELCDYKKIFPIPCGYVGFIEAGGKKNDHIYELDKKPLTEREYDLFYSGQKSTNRVSFTYNINKIKDKFNSYVKETEGFRQGLFITDYFKMMNNSKICLAPNGKVIPESFRYMEGFESNSIVITTYPRHNSKFDLWYYKESTAIFLKDWNELKEGMIKELLTEDKLNEYFVKNKEYYNNYLSTNATCNYILDIIKN